MWAPCPIFVLRLQTPSSKCLGHPGRAKAKFIPSVGSNRLPHDESCKPFAISFASRSRFLSHADRGFFREPIAVSFASRSRFLSRADRGFFPGRPQFLLQADRDNFKRPFAIVWRNESQLHFESNRRNGPTRGVARCERRAVELVSEIQFSACVRGNNGVLQVSEPGKRNTILTEMSVNAYGSG